MIILDMPKIYDLGKFKCSARRAIKHTHKH